MTQIGLIGMGDMGQLYARKFSEAGFQVNVCDVPENYETLCGRYATVAGVAVFRDGHDVSRCSDFIIYSVETAKFAAVVQSFAKSTKFGAIVAGQTSVKGPEIAAFEAYMPADVQIVTCHSLHGPQIDTKDQTLVVMKHRASDHAHQTALAVLRALESNIVELSCEEHDRITADTQAVTHMAFLSMGTAWSSTGVFPWLNETYIGGIENAKVLTTMRIYTNKWHVYAGLALLNPSARSQVSQYAQSVSALFKLMIQEKEADFRSRITTAAEFVFGNAGGQHPILLSDDWLDEFSLSSIPKGSKKNSHLSILAIVDSWYQLKLSPYHHMICQTPPFRMWLGITEYLFRSPEMLELAIQTALYDKSIRGDDLEFVNATQTWSQTILLGSMDGYRERFEETSKFFRAKASDDVKRLSSQMLQRITKKYQQTPH